MGDAADAGKASPRALTGDSSASRIPFRNAYETPSRARKIRPTPIPTDASIACSPIPNANPVE
jgi:hypothetical protein